MSDKSREERLQEIGVRVPTGEDVDLPPLIKPRPKVVAFFVRLWRWIKSRVR